MAFAVRAAVDPHQHRCGFSDTHVQNSFARLEAGLTANRDRPDSLTDFIEDPDSLIRIHFDRTGPNAVPPTDTDFSGVPDYAEEALRSMLYALRVYVDTMLYTPPPNDAPAGGSKALDVYLHDLSKSGPTGGGWYGSTEPETKINSNPPFRYISWIEIDNDFSPDDRNVYDLPVYSTFGINALRVTCSHELHHSVQIGGYGSSAIQKMIYEMCSVWMEIRTWPNIYDWTAYTQHILTEPYLWPFSDASTTGGYAWGWYGNAFAMYHGDAGMRRMWENVKAGDKPFAALVNAASQAGRSFSEDFCNDMTALYYTGSRGRNNSPLPYSDSLPEITLAVDAAVKPPSEVANGTIRPFEVCALRFSVPSIISTDPPYSIAVVLTWPDEAAMIASESSARTPYSITLGTTSWAGAMPVAGTAWYIQVGPANICYHIEGASTARTESPYPQPIVLSKSRTVYIPVADAIPGDEVTIALMTVQTLGISKSTSTVILDDTRIVAPYTLPDDLVTGTYLLEVDMGDKKDLVKISVRR